MKDHAPPYNPAEHQASGDDPGPTVYVEMYCKCGVGVWRQRDPVAYVERSVRSFQARHSGPACGDATKAEFAEARRARTGPREFANLDDTDDAARPWPVLED